MLFLEFTGISIGNKWPKFAGKNQERGSGNGISRFGLASKSVFRRGNSFPLHGAEDLKRKNFWGIKKVFFFFFFFFFFVFFFFLCKGGRRGGPPAWGPPGGGGVLPPEKILKISKDFYLKIPYFSKKNFDLKPREKSGLEFAPSSPVYMYGIGSFIITITIMIMIMIMII